MPFGGESLPFGDLAAFVHQAESGGAIAASEALAVLVPNDDTIIDCLQGEIDDSRSDSRSDAAAPFIRLDATEVAEAIDILEAIEENEGDARMQLSAVRELRRRLTRLAIDR